MKLLFDLKGYAYGGFESQIELLIKTLSSKGHQCLVLCPKGPVAKAFEPFSSVFSPSHLDWNLELQRFKPDLVITVQGDIFALAAAAKRQQIPSIWLCGFDPSLLPETKTITALSGLFDAVCAPSNDLASKLQTLFDLNAIALSCAVDPKHFNPNRDNKQLRRALGIEPKDFVIGYVARFAEHKRHSDLIDLLTSSGNDSRLLLVGWGDQRNQKHFDTLVAKSKYLGVHERTHFVQALPNCVPDFLSVMDTFVAPAENEGLGVAMLEAMAMKRPVVVAESGGATEPLKIGGCGRSYPLGDLDALSAQLKELKDSKRLRKSEGEKAREAVLSYYSPEKLTHDFELLATRLRTAACTDALPRLL